jgi:hypothetical protein
MDIPSELKPLRLRLAGVKDRVALVYFLVLYIVIVVISSIFVLHADEPSSTIVGDFLKVFGTVGDGLAVGVLILTNFIIKPYTEAEYIKTYLPIAKQIPEYHSRSDDELRTLLGTFYGDLTKSTSNILTSDFGATLIAISTVLAFIGDFIKKGS